MEFGRLNGVPAELIRLTDGGCAAELISFGAALRALWVPDRSGRLTDVVLGFDRLEDYVNQDCYIGATVGPVANRIAGAACLLGRKVLTLDRNDGENCLHSGAAGLNRVVWDVAEATRNEVRFVCTHPDGRGGIPGPIRFAVRYRLEGPRLTVEYRAVSERDTLCNLTNHSYFNLNGQGSGSVAGHRIAIHAAAFTPTDSHSIPTGELRSVEGTPMDLRKPTRIGDGLDSDDVQIRQARGYDHNWALDGRSPAAVAEGDRSGIRLTLETDRPGVQFYTGNYLPAGMAGKGSAVYGPRSGFCLETQAFPDAPHHAGFPSIFLPAGQVWESRTVFGFSVAL